jgi:predicted KAP-like P-loop ATPase
MLPVYFRLSVPANVISREELNAVIQAAGQGTDELREQLVRLMALRTPTGEMRLILLLDWLEDHTADIEPGAFQTIASVLVDQGDRIHEGQGPRGMLEPDADIRILRILFQLFKRLPTQAARYSIYKLAIDQAASIYFPAEIVAVLGQEHGRRSNQPVAPEDQREIGGAQLRKLEQLTVKKLRQAAANGALAAAPLLLALLLDWREWGGDRGPRAFARKLIADDRGMVRLIESTLSQGARKGMGDYASTLTWHIQIEAFDPLVDLRTLNRRVHQLLQVKPEWLTERQRLALEVFEREAAKRVAPSVRRRRGRPQQP